MKKTSIILGFVAAALMCATTLSAQTTFSKMAPTGQTLWYYQANDAVDSVWVIAPNATSWGAYTKPSGNLVIPDSVVRYGNTYRVSGILSYAFRECSGLRSVVLGDGIPTIGIEAFKDCTGMTDITLGKRTLQIHANAFENCVGLDWIKLRGYTILVDSSAFVGVDTETPVYVPCNTSSLIGMVWHGFGSFEEQVMYTVNATANQSYRGSVTVDGDPTCDSSYVRLVAVPSSEVYRFVCWSDGDTTNPRLLHLTSDTTIQAYFDFESYPTNYTITAVSNNEQMGTVAGGGSFAVGTNITLVALPNDGYRFVRWNDNVTTAVRSVVVLAPATYTAYFEALDGIEPADAQELRVAVAGRRLTLDGTNADEAGVYSVDGRCLFHGVIRGTTEINLPVAGVYIIRTTCKAFRVVVR